MRLASLLLFMILPISAVHADESVDTKMILQRQWEERLTPLIKAYDPAAMIWVRLTPKKADTKDLPSLPFQYEDITLRSESARSKMNLESAEVQILSYRNEWPETIKDILEQLTVELGVKPQIKFQVLPPPPTPKKDAAPQAPAPYSNGMPELIQFLESQRPFIWLFLGSLGLFFVVLLVYFMWNRTHQREMKSSLQQSLEKLTDAFGEQAQARPSFSQSQKGAGGQEIFAAEERVDADEEIELPPRSLYALLQDSYWCEMDGFAAWVWSRLPSEQRNELLKSHPEVKPYIETLLDRAPEPGRDHRDPSYSEPLPIERMSNADLSRFVLLHPTLYGHLSRMRKRGLRVGTLERLRLERETHRSLDPKLLEELSKHQSKKRTLQTLDAVEPRSLEEELALYDHAKSGKLGIDDRAAILSLTWMQDLPHGVIQEMLQGFSAQDLAEAWIGPETTLQAFEKFVPEKKLKLLRSYLSRGTPSRQSACFRELHRVTIEKLRTLDASSQKKPSSNVTKIAA